MPGGTIGSATRRAPAPAARPGPTGTTHADVGPKPRREDERPGPAREAGKARMTKRLASKYKINRRLGENLWGRAKSPVAKPRKG